MSTSSTSQELNAAELAGIRWRVGRQPASSGSCVEVGFLTDGSDRVALRHSDHADGPVIVYTAKEWAAFTAGVNDGEFDFG